LIAEYIRLKTERDRYHAALYGIAMGLSLSRSEIVEMAHEALQATPPSPAATEGGATRPTDDRSA
jgi:hypothetical protein